MRIRIVVLGLAGVLMLSGLTAFAKGGGGKQSHGGSTSKKQAKTQKREQKQTQEQKQARKRERKQERAMIQAFDSDKNGELSDEEIGAARGALERLSKGKGVAEVQ